MESNFKGFIIWLSPNFLMLLDVCFREFQESIEKCRRWNNRLKWMISLLYLCINIQSILLLRASIHRCIWYFFQHTLLKIKYISKSQEISFYVPQTSFNGLEYSTRSVYIYKYIYLLVASEVQYTILFWLHAVWKNFDSHLLWVSFKLRHLCKQTFCVFAR